MGSSSSADRSSTTEIISQPQRRSNVVLVDASFESETFASSVILGSGVRLRAAQRSGLLSAIGDTEGVATLPSTLSPEDVRLWQTACLVNCEPSDDELVKILQVADVLGDPAAEVWVDKFAQRARSLGSPWQSQPGGPKLICALMQLAPHLRTRVLSACINNTNTTLMGLLAAFPPVFHTALISCAVAGARGSLEVDVPPQSQDTFLPLLSSTAMPPPGLLNLSFVAQSADASNAALLADVLVHHTGLTALTLNASLPPAWLRALGLCVPPGALPTLQYLGICVNACRGSSVALSGCLGSFTAITRLNLLLLCDSLGASSDSLTSYVSAASSPALLPRLESLTITEELADAATSHSRAPAAPRAQPSSSHMYSGSGLDRLLHLLAAPAVTSLPFSANLASLSWPELLYYLQEYSVLPPLDAASHNRVSAAPRAQPSSSHSSLDRLLPLLAAPALTSLSFSSNLSSISWPELLFHLQQCTVLQILELDTDMSAPEEAPTPAGMRRCLTPLDDSSPEALPSLQTLNITSQSPIASLQTATLLSPPAASSLTRLSLAHSHAPLGPGGKRLVRSCTNEQAAKAWEDLAAALRQCTRLACLRLRVPLSDHISSEGSEALSSAIGCMPQLTWLSLGAGGLCGQCFSNRSCALDGQALGRAMLALPRLQRLHIGGGATCTVSELESLLEILPSAKGLTTLGLCCGGISQVALNKLIPKLRPLKELRLLETVFGGADGEATLDVFAARYPKVKISTRADG